MCVYVCDSIHERIARAVFTLSGVSAQFRFYNGSVFVRLSAQVGARPFPKNSSNNPRTRRGLYPTVRVRLASLG